MEKQGGIGQKAVISQIQKSVESVPERFPGYRNELMSTLAEILFMERQHEQKAMKIVKELTIKVEGLGAVIDIESGTVDGK